MAATQTQATSFPPAANGNVPASSKAQGQGGANAATADSGFSFSDLLDIVNPLQHIPVVSTIYRAITGDTIKPVERIAGDTLYGGALGFISSLANVAFEQITGRDVGDTVLALVEGKSLGSPGTAVASAAAVPERIATGAPRPLIPAAVAAAQRDPVTPATAIPAVAVAETKPAARPAATATEALALAPTLADPSGFMAALQSKNVDPALAMRAMFAYQKSLGLGAVASAQP